MNDHRPNIKPKSLEVILSENNFTQLDVARVLLAWEAGELSEGQVSTLFQTDRVSTREVKLQMINDGKIAAEKLLAGKEY